MEYTSYLVHFNPNHDPKSGRFTTGNGSSVTSKIGTRLKKADLLNLDNNAWRDYKDKTGTYKRMVNAAVTGMKAMAKTGDPEPWEEYIKNPNQGWEDWFLFEDQTFGMPQIADLANKGKSKDEILQIIKDSVEYGKEDPYTDIPGVWYLNEWESSNQYYTVDGSKYIDACIEAAKENKQVTHSGTTEFGNYLCHFNRNHSPKNGQFTYGDGDGDGSSDERGRRGRYKPEAIGTHGNQTSVTRTPSDDPTQKLQKFAIKSGLKLAVKGATFIAGKAFAKTAWGKQFKELKNSCIQVGRYTLANTDLNKSLKGSGIPELGMSIKSRVNRTTDKIYDRAADSILKKVNEYE